MNLSSNNRRHIHANKHHSVIQRIGVVKAVAPLIDPITFQNDLIPGIAMKFERIGSVRQTEQF